MTSTKGTWRFPRQFWLANLAELFERAAYYGTFIVLALYLTDEVGFTDVETGYVAAFFASFIYLLPTFMGALADKFNFRRSLILAFALLTSGYFLLGLLQNKVTVLIALGLIVIGGSFIKPVITGTVAKCSDDHNRARAFSIFYQMVNIGAFSGKTFAKPLRTELGLAYINYYSAAMALIALVLVFFFFKVTDTSGQGKPVRELVRGLFSVLRNGRFMSLILIVAGFWAIQGQLYASMPKYVMRMVGPGASPEWLANVNPLMVVLLVVPITHLVRKVRPVNAIGISLMIIPFSALAVALSPVLEDLTGSSIDLMGLAFHPITVTLILGIALQGLSECFLSPKFLEFASKQAPPGEVGMYMGYSHLHTFFAWFLGFILSGYLLNAFCPDPATLSPEVRDQWQRALEGQGPMPEAYSHAHYIWFVFAAIGVVAFCALLIFRFITDRMDAKRALGAARAAERA